MMNQDSLTPERPATRAPVFFWITVGLLAMLLLGGAGAALWLVQEGPNINRSGGWGWLLVGGICVAAITIVCAACALCTAVSIFRREPHRRLSVTILIIACLVVWTFGPRLIRVVNRLRQQHEEQAGLSKRSPQPPADSNSRPAIAPSAAQSSKAPTIRAVEDEQILELKSRVWAALNATNAEAFVDCFFIEERFNTPEVREANRNQVAVLLGRETLDLEIENIPDKELVQIMKIQNAKPASLVRYSLFPRLMLRIRQNAANGSAGRRFLIGEQDGKWYIITLAGHTT